MDKRQCYYLGCREVAYWRVRFTRTEFRDACPKHKEMVEKLEKKTNPYPEPKATFTKLP